MTQSRSKAKETSKHPNFCELSEKFHASTACGKCPQVTYIAGAEKPLRRRHGLWRGMRSEKPGRMDTIRSAAIADRVSVLFTITLSFPSVGLTSPCCVRSCPLSRPPSPHFVPSPSGPSLSPSFPLCVFVCLLLSAHCGFSFLFFEVFSLLPSWPLFPFSPSFVGRFCLCFERRRCVHTLRVARTVPLVAHCTVALYTFQNVVTPHVAQAVC